MEIKSKMWSQPTRCKYSYQCDIDETIITPDHSSEELLVLYNPHYHTMIVVGDLLSHSPSNLKERHEGAGLSVMIRTYNSGV